MWIVPTYNRPEKFARFIAAVKATGCTTPGVVVLNGSPDGYDLTDLPTGWSVLTTEPEGMVKAVNRAFAQFPDEPWYGMLVDDSEPKTSGWDKRLIEAGMKSGIASCNDNDQAPRRMCGAVVFRGDLIRTAGFFYPPCTWHAYGDDFWEMVGKQYNCWAVLMDVVVEHRHPFKHLDQMDATHERSYNSMGADKEAYHLWLHSAEGHAAFVGLGAVLGARQRDVDLKGKSVCFATPAFGGKFDMQYVRSLTYSAVRLREFGIDFFTVFVTNDSLIHKARNNIVRSFLQETTASHLLFADADMGWDPDAVLRLLSHEKDVVAAAGIRKEDPISFCYRPHVDNHICNETGCWKVESVGTGFMLIARHVIEKMIEAHPELKHVDAKGQEFHALFYNELRDGKDWSEDYTFCKRWGDLGGSIWMDPTVSLEHVGGKVWSGSVAQESMVVRH